MTTNIKTGRVVFIFILSFFLIFMGIEPLENTGNILYLGVSLSGVGLLAVVAYIMNTTKPPEYDSTQLPPVMIEY